jgi:hypothetical protein
MSTITDQLKALQSATAAKLNALSQATQTAIGQLGADLGQQFQAIISQIEEPNPPPQPTVPVAPHLIAASATSPTSVALTWTDDADNETGYRVERDGVEIGTAPANAASYADTGLVPGRTYAYRVRAFNAAGNGGYSPTATVTTPLPQPQTLPAPANFSATLTAAGVQLSWSTVPGADKYVLHRTADPMNPGDPDVTPPIATLTASPGAQSVTYLDKTAVPGDGMMMYRYCPAAVAADGTVGPCSPDVTVAVPAKPPVNPPPTPTDNLIADGSFEAQALGSGNYKYNLTGSAWVFTGQSGLTANQSGFTSGNPAAPDGAQVAFLQSNGSFSQSVTLPAGTYVLGFFAAQRLNAPSSQDFTVLVDDVVVGTFTPESDGYSAYATTAFSVDNGTHAITFRGLNTAGGDNTAFIDNVFLSPGRTLPPRHDEMAALMDLAMMDADFVVKAGESKTLPPGNYKFKTLRVDDGGFLDIPQGGVSVVYDNAFPFGHFRIGRPDARIPKSNPVTFTCSNDSGPLTPDAADPLHLRRGFIAMGATIEFYGELPQTIPDDKMNWWDDANKKWTVTDIDRPYVKTPGEPDMTAPDALVRAIRFVDEVPGPATGGHFMFMHEQKSVTLSGCYFKTGRTDKSVPVTDPVWGKPETYANVRGRYAGPHAHRCGPDGTELLWEYNVSEDGASWAYNNHDSRVRARWNIDTNAFGVGFNNEIGDEDSRVEGHISDRIRGFDPSPNVPLGDIKNDDWGRSGTAVWTQAGGGTGYIRDVRAGGQSGAAVTMIHITDRVIPIRRLRELAAGAVPEYKDAIDAIDNRMPGHAGAVFSSQVPFFVSGLAASTGTGWAGWAGNNPYFLGTPAAPAYSVIRDSLVEGAGSLYCNNVRFLRVRFKASARDAYTGFGYAHSGVVFGQHMEDCDFLDHRAAAHCPTTGQNVISGGTSRCVCDFLITNQAFPNKNDPTSNRTLTISSVKFLDLPDGFDYANNRTRNPWGIGSLPPGRWHYAYRPWYPDYSIEDYSEWDLSNPQAPNLFSWVRFVGYDAVKVEHTEEPGRMVYFWPDELCEDYVVRDDAGRLALPIPDEVLAPFGKAGRVTSGDIALKTDYRLWGTEPLPRKTMKNALGIWSDTPAVVIADPKVWAR